MERHLAAQDASVDIGKIVKFLFMRPDAEGKSILFNLGSPALMEGGWVRFPWVAFDEDNLPLTGASEWEPAWHGCKLEAVYSEMYHRRLSEFCDSGPGAHFLSESPGASREGLLYVPLCADGIFWSAQWEVRVDRSEDDLVHNERSVYIAALWMLGVTSDDMLDGCEVSEKWDPLLEADPRRGKMAGVDVVNQAGPAAMDSAATAEGDVVAAAVEDAD